jgi:hypothetical protein
VKVAAALLAALMVTGFGAAAATAAGPSGETALRAAKRIAGYGARPAAGPAEGRAHAYVKRSFAAAGLRVGVQRFRVPGRGTSRNVIGVLAGRSRCLRIVMAHTDSAHGPGANDNASGVGVLIALAPRLRALGPRCDTWLVATGSEERIVTGARDHLGALALAGRVRARGLRGRLRWALSLDEVGRDGVGRAFWLRSPARRPRAGVERSLLASARRTGVPVRFVRDGRDSNSDHREFALLGMPAAKLGTGAAGEPCRHRACDRPGRLRRLSLARAQRVVERALVQR